MYFSHSRDYMNGAEICLRVRVCVREKERDRKRDRERGSNKNSRISEGAAG